MRRIEILHASLPRRWTEAPAANATSEFIHSAANANAFSCEIERRRDSAVFRFSWESISDYPGMADALDILNPNNPLLDSEEEDDDFEPGMEMVSATERPRGASDK